MLDPLDEPVRVKESPEFRRTHYRVYDEDGFLKSFSIVPPLSATLGNVIDYLCAKFPGIDGTGYASKDLVVLLGPRIVAVVLKGADGQPEVTTFLH